MKRLIQHKKEAYWFYRFLSIFYDKLVNPLFWTEPMRDKALTLARLDHRGLTVIDVGSGTGFTTQGIVRWVDTCNVTCVDQSPHQMAKARLKADLEGCTFRIGDAENIPFPPDHFDRYVSAGSIEYWPDPQRGIQEAYRVIRPGGVALLIGPLEPKNAFSRFIANTWMLFPKEEEYLEWFVQAGFKDIRITYVSPHWVRQKDNYGIAIAGVKMKGGPSPAIQKKKNEEQPEKEPITIGRNLILAGRVLLGSLAGFIFIPVALFGYLRAVVFKPGSTPKEEWQRLNTWQIVALFIFLALIAGLAWWVW